MRKVVLAGKGQFFRLKKTRRSKLDFGIRSDQTLLNSQLQKQKQHSNELASGRMNIP